MHVLQQDNRQISPLDLVFDAPPVSCTLLCRLEAQVLPQSIRRRDPCSAMQFSLWYSLPDSKERPVCRSLLFCSILILFGRMILKIMLVKACRVEIEAKSIMKLAL